MDLFHPAVAGWLSSTLGNPTPPQAKAWPAIKARRPTLIAAPTGSGKTLAAFLAVIDDLTREGLENGGLPDHTRVVYVSPLKALSNDIELNLHRPLEGIRERLAQAGEPDLEIRTSVRTGDTPARERTAMLKRPPHILVTTPESLYILLTSEGGRRMLANTDTVIVDEIHAMVGNKRGSHLAVTLERLDDLVKRPVLRIGLSATQKPIAAVADFLFRDGDREVVDLGHRRSLDLALELPSSPLEAVMSNEVWEEIYDRLADLVAGHSTTIVFVNTRRLAERIAKNLSDRLGKRNVTSHHGSLSRDQRLESERRLKAGELRALVATASLELGIDIGKVDLVCQIGSTRTIATLLQRVGRSGHTIDGVSKGRLFPLSRDELAESVALLRCIAEGELDRLVIPDKPLDILAQQIVAAVASSEYEERELFELICRAYPFRDLSWEEFSDVIAMLRDGFTSRNGRRGAYLHHDRVNGRLRGRRGARLAALTNGGAIPDTADYDVVLEPGDTRVGSVNEDFAVESLPGNIFQLGNASWRILRIEPGKVRVADARGQPPTIPFWFGEAPSRSAELSKAVAELRDEISRHSATEGPEDVAKALLDTPGVSAAAARQLSEYLVAGRKALGAMPTQQTLVLERFFDESGGMQLVLHSPFGSRLNRAWGLALRKRFCRKFNFELQAAATEDAIVLSLGVTHSFPLEEVFTYLHPDTVRHVLTQALLDAPMFNVRWRWNAGRALAVLRFRGGKRVPPQLQRMNAEDLISVVFPDQLACFENIAGEREIPDHPLVNQTLRDCLDEAMDIDRLEELLTRLRSGQIQIVTRDLTEPSPLAQEILNARPYAFLDDAPLEERRTQAVLSRRWLDPESASDLGALDEAAIAAVREEAWPQAESADELHDALVLAGFLSQEETSSDVEAGWKIHLQELSEQGRVTQLTDGTRSVWVAAERASELAAIRPDWAPTPPLDLPAALRQIHAPEDALPEVLRGRLEILGPVTPRALAAPLDLDMREVETALAALEAEGFVLRGHFSHDTEETEWCERRLLARIHRRTLKRLRAEIEPVSAEAFLRFLLGWHHLEEGEHKAGPKGLEEVVYQLEGFEVPAGGWEVDVLPDRVEDYEAAWLDGLCLGGKTVWQRRSPPPLRDTTSAKPGPVRSTPIALLRRGNRELWSRIGGAVESQAGLSVGAQQVLSLLRQQGASFFDDLCKGTGLLQTQLEGCLAELAARGLVSSDTFLGLRALLVPSARRKPFSGTGRRRSADFGLDDAGRWVAIAEETGEEDSLEGFTAQDELFEEVARILLRRWGVVFRRLLDREGALPPWRDLLRAFRRLEARGEVRGGRFIAGFSGEQFALPEAVSALRKHRQEPDRDQWTAVSAADPLNLVGILTPGARLHSVSANRVLFRNGRPVVLSIAGDLRFLEPLSDKETWEARKRLERRQPAAKAALTV